MQFAAPQNTGNNGFYRSTAGEPVPDDHHDTIGPEPDVDDSATVSWEASEYIHRSKDFGWLIGFIAVVLVGLSISIFFQQWILAVLIIVMAIAMGVFAFRPPKTKHYTLTHQGLMIDEHLYHLADFRSFGIDTEEAIYSITLIPRKRFLPSVIVYFAEEDGEKIVDILGSHLPLEELAPDPIDAIMRRLHF